MRDDSTRKGVRVQTKGMKMSSLKSLESSKQYNLLMSKYLLINAFRYIYSHLQLNTVFWKKVQYIQNWQTIDRVFV